MTRPCTKCRVVKSFEDFNKRKKASSGISSVCRECTKNLQAEWRSKNHAYVIQRSRDYHWENRERILKRKRAKVAECRKRPPRLAIGSRFGHFSVVGDTKMPSGHLFYQCQCDCGMAVSVEASKLRRGKVTSCSECRRQVRAANSPKNYPEYTNWIAMRERCRNPRRIRGKDYVGRGITVCPEWGSFEQFYADMGPKTSPNHSIDRIDNDGPYAPWNCRWATRSEQQRNRRNSLLITYAGRTQSVHAWAEELGLKPSTLTSRIERGWPPDRIIETPWLPRNKRHIFRDQAPLLALDRSDDDHGSRRAG